LAESKPKIKSQKALVFIIAGKEEFLVNGEYERLLDGLIEPEQRTLGLFNADPSMVAISQVFDELRTLPFLCERRVVAIKGADEFISENRQLFEKYFDSPSPTGVLVMTVSTWSAQTKLAKKLPEIGKLISVGEIKPWEIPQRLAQYANEAHGKNLNREAAALLTEYGGDEIGRLYSEVDKLSLFTENAKSITADDVERLAGHNRLFNSFEVIDAIVEDKISDAIERLRGMLSEDKSAEYTVVGAFAYHFRRMFNAKVMLERGSSRVDVSGVLRLRRNKEDGFFRQLNRMTLRQIGGVLQQLAEMDAAIKTGQTKAEVAIEQLVIKLASGINQVKS
jgi:DNA polymerase III subunit delta